MRPNTQAKRLFLAATCSLCVLLAGPCQALANGAGALEPGVHVDPESPAGKEYALPLATARQIGAGSTHGGEGHLFGAGITASGSGGPPGSGAASGSKRRVHTSSGKRSREATSARAAASRRRSLATDAPGSGDGSLLALLGGGVVIVVLGGFGGTVLRHSRRPHGLSSK